MTGKFPNAWELAPALVNLGMDLPDRPNWPEQFDPDQIPVIVGGST